MLNANYLAYLESEGLDYDQLLLLKETLLKFRGLVFVDKVEEIIKGVIEWQSFIIFNEDFATCFNFNNDCKIKYQYTLFFHMLRTIELTNVNGVLSLHLSRKDDISLLNQLTAVSKESVAQLNLIYNNLLGLKLNYLNCLMSLC